MTVLFFQLRIKALKQQQLLMDQQHHAAQMMLLKNQT